MTKVTKEAPKHTDILGQPLAEGNYVAVSHHNTMYVCQIRKITPKQIRVCPIKSRYYSEDGWLTYPASSVLLSGPDALAYILIHSGG